MFSNIVWRKLHNPLDIQSLRLFSVHPLAYLIVPTPPQRLLGMFIRRIFTTRRIFVIIVIIILKLITYIIF